MGSAHDNLQSSQRADEPFGAPDEAYGWMHAAGIIASIYALLFLAYLAVVLLGQWGWLFVLTPVLGAQIYKITIIMHDCAHYSLFANRKTNEQVGTIVGWFIGTEFRSFARTHWKHHSRYGEEDDPQGPDYLGLQNAKPGALIWHLARPLLGYNLTKLFKFGGAPISVQANTTGSKWGFLIGVLAAQLSLALVATGFCQEPWLVFLYPFAAATWALFFSQVRGFAEHVVAPPESPRGFARTHLPNIFDRVFFYTLNFNYHVEHHAFPSVPSCRLGDVRSHLSDAQKSASSDSILKTLAWRISEGCSR